MIKDFKVGDKVRVLVQGSSVNPFGSVGKITAINSKVTCRVLVKGFSDDNLVNNHLFSDLKLASTKEQKIEKLLKKISKLNKK